MSFSGSTDNIPAPQQKTLGISAERTSTNEQARPVPYFAGMQRMGVTWLGQAFNKRNKEITQDAKKTEVTIGREYWIGCAGLVCLGPVDILLKILFDNQPVWTGEIWRAGDSTSIAIEGYGTMRFYWGTETQTRDATLSALENATGDDPIEIHGAYRGICYFVFENLYLGAGVTSAPQIEFILGRYPQPGWMSRQSNTDGDLNALAVASEILENTFYGLGTESRIETATFDAAATRLSDECFGVSPILTREQRASKTLIEIAETVGGNWIPTNDGKLGFKLRRQESTVGIPHFREKDLISPPDFQIPDYKSGSTEIRITYSDRRRNHLETQEVEFDLTSRARAVDSNPETLDRRMITRGSVAAGVAKLALIDRRRPLPEGSIQIRKSSLGALRVGDIFRFSYPHSNLCNQLARAVRINTPDPTEPAVEIDFKIEHETGLILNSAPESPEPPPENTVDPVPLAHSEIIEIPRLPYEDQSALYALVARGSAMTSAVTVWQLLDGSYKRVKSFSQFAQRGALDAPLFDNGVVFDDDGMTFTLEGIDTVLEAPGDYSGLDLLVKIGDEIIGIYSQTLQSAGKYHVKCVRGRLGTEPENHAADSPVWVFRLRADSHWKNQTNATPQTFKLQPSVRNGVPYPLSEIDPLNVNFTNLYRRPYSPVDLEVNGARESAHYRTGDDLEITWTCFDEFDLDIEDRWNETAGTCPSGVIRLMDETGAQVKEYLVNGESLTIGNAELVDAFGSEPDSFSIRAYQRIDYLDSLEFETVDVTKI